jgi:hypothetical protein
MSVRREDLLWLVEELPEDEVPVVLDTAFRAPRDHALRTCASRRTAHPACGRPACQGNGGVNRLADAASGYDDLLSRGGQPA